METKREDTIEHCSQMLKLEMYKENVGFQEHPTNDAVDFLRGIIRDKLCLPGVNRNPDVFLSSSFFRNFKKTGLDTDAMTKMILAIRDQAFCFDQDANKEKRCCLNGMWPVKCDFHFGDLSAGKQHINWDYCVKEVNAYLQRWTRLQIVYYRLPSEDVCSMELNFVKQPVLISMSDILFAVEHSSEEEKYELRALLDLRLPKDYAERVFPAHESLLANNKGVEMESDSLSDNDNGKHSPPDY